MAQKIVNSDEFETSVSAKPRKRRVKRLKSAHDATRFIAGCIADTQGGGDIGKNYKLCMMACMFLKAVEVSDLETRITELEKKVSGNAES